MHSVSAVAPVPIVESLREQLSLHDLDQCVRCRQHEVQPEQQENDVSLVPPSLLQLDLAQQLEISQPVTGSPRETRHNVCANSSPHADLSSSAYVLAAQAGQPAGTACCSDEAASRSHCSKATAHDQQRSLCNDTHANSMPQRGLSGILTPLGKLAGMFGWTPDKPNEPLNQAQAFPAAARIDHMRPGRKKLAELTRPANSPAVSAQLPASLLQLRPEQLTLQQLQNLQKAAELLSPTRAMPLQSMPHSPSAAVISLGRHPEADTSDTDQTSMRRCAGPQQDSVNNELHSHMAVTYPGPTHPCQDRSPNLAVLAEQATQIAKDEVMSEDDGDDGVDMLAAALVSKLGMMAPHLSCLYRGEPSSTCGTPDRGVRHGGDLLTYPGRQAALKRKHAEEPQEQEHAAGHETGSSHAKQAQTPAALMLTVPIPQQVADAGPPSSDDQAVDNAVHAPIEALQCVLQHCPAQPSVHSRKRFRKTTGMEVLHRCMPSLWHHQPQTREMHQ